MPCIRKHLTGPETVEVHQFTRLDSDLGALAYFKEINGSLQRVDDIVRIPAFQVMDILLHVEHGKFVTATLVPETLEDDHPQVNSAVIEGTNPVPAEVV